MIKMSEAASIALHAMVILAADPERYHCAREMSRMLGVSEAHLSKVCQRLSRMGLVESVRGPRGGFKLGLPGDSITLLSVLEAVDGPLKPKDCLMHTKTCRGDECIMGGFLRSFNRDVLGYLEVTKIDELRGLYQ